MPTNLIAVTPAQRGWAYRRLVQPLVRLLKSGMTPERLAWSLALGLVVGINPVLGSTTVACLVLAFVFRLNLVASQIATHLVYPLELLLLIPFLRISSHLFHLRMPPLYPQRLLHLARTHPITFTRRLWAWEVHALLIWVGVALVLAPLAALALTPVLRRLHLTSLRHQPGSSRS